MDVIEAPEFSFAEFVYLCLCGCNTHIVDIANRSSLFLRTSVIFAVLKQIKNKKLLIMLFQASHWLAAHRQWAARGEGEWS